MKQQTYKLFLKTLAFRGARAADALPGAVTKDFKQLQYFSGVNQTGIVPTNNRR